jgi:uncharacterized protein YaaN involved in tellurite resistance
VFGLTDGSVNAINGNIIIANQDSIMLLGVEPQNRLRDFSKTISKMLLESNIDMDVTISQVIAEIEQFQNQGTANKTPKLSFMKQKQHEELISKYYNLLDYIDKVTLYFQLQQAQLLKEVKLLEKLDLIVKESSKELEECVENANQILQHKSTVYDNGEQKEWFDRLERRLEDLKISHTVSLQNQVQIKMLYDNNLLLIDKISSTLSNTFPVWRNQMAILLGVELLESRLNAQNKVLKITEDYIKQTNKKVRRTKISNKASPINIENLLELNEKLKTALSEMNLVEENDANIRKNFHKILY